MLNRRSFFGTIFGFLGLGSVVKGSSEKPKNISSLRGPEWIVARSRVQRAWEKRGLRLHWANPEETVGELFDRVADQMVLTGVGYIWTVPNKLGEVIEAYVLPTENVVACPALEPNYPDGYYRIQPIYPYNRAVDGAVIPAKWVMRVKLPHSLARYGYSPLTAARLHMDEMESIDKARWRWFSVGHYPQPDGSVKHFK